MKPKIDINCDLGESYGAFRLGNDAEIMPHITSANIACGFHAGDPMTIARTVNLAKKHKVAIGAHPGYPDLMGFGRREMQLAPAEVENYIIYQASALEGFAKTANLKLQHLKPHGALYNEASQNKELAKAIIGGVKKLDSSLIVFAPHGSELAKVARHAGLKVAYEFFADRAYNPDGSLVSRAQSDAVIENTEKVVERTVKAACEGVITAVDGSAVILGDVHTVCVHGDTTGAVKLAEVLRKGLTRAGIEVKSVGSFI